MYGVRKFGGLHGDCMLNRSGIVLFEDVLE